MANKAVKNKPARRTLKDGEYYNNGRYEYKYKDKFGKVRTISSYTLLPGDKPPKGKRTGKSLREKEAEIEKLLDAGLDFEGAKMTLLDATRKFLEYLYNRKNLAHNTRVGYQVTVNTLEQYRLGHMRLADIKMSDCEDWLTDMKKKYRGGTIQRDISLIKRVFEWCVDNEYISKNPFRKITTDRSDAKKIEALTAEEMNKFLDFCKNDAHSRHCYDLLVVMFGTGMRCSEVCGLTLDDIDMEKKLIHVEKQLMCINHTHVVVPPKTKNAIRYIPMSTPVYEAFERILQNRYIKGDIEPKCYDERGKEYSGFVFLATRSRKTIVRGHIEEYLLNCIKRYNLANPDAPLRKFEPHVMRHTFATNMQTLPAKSLQMILGHGNISTTMNIYVDMKPFGEIAKQMNEVLSSIS